MSKKPRIEYESREENAFSLSTGDLMAGLLFIFILLLMGALLQVQEKAEEDERIVQKYDQIKTQLYIDLQEEFKEDLKVWRATIDSTLCIRFQEPAMLFDNAKLSVNFKSDEYVELLKKHGIDVVFHKSPNRVYKKPTSKSVVYFDLICDKYGSCEETKSHYIVRNASWVLVARKHEDGTKQTILITKTTDMFSMDLPTHTWAK